MFIVWFGVCFVCYAIRTVFNVMIYHKHPWLENKKIMRFIFLVMGILWYSWFSMCFSDPVRMSIPDWIRYAGFIFFLTGVFLFLFAHIKMRGRLIQEQNRGSLGKGPGDQGELPFSSAEAGAGPLGQMKDAHGLHGLVGHRIVVFGRGREAAQVGSPAHDHNVSDEKGEGGDL